MKVCISFLSQINSLLPLAWHSITRIATITKEPRRWCEILSNGTHDHIPLNITCGKCDYPPEREDGSSINSMPSTRAPSQLTVTTTQASDSSSLRVGVISTQSDIDLTTESLNTPRSQRVIPIISPQKTASVRYELNLSSNGGAHGSISEYYRQVSTHKT